MSPGTASRRREMLIGWLAAAVLHDPWDDRWPMIVAGLDAAIAATRDLATVQDRALADAGIAVLLAEQAPGPRHPDSHGWDHRGHARAQLRLLLADRFLLRAGTLAAESGAPLAPAA